MKDIVEIFQERFPNHRFEKRWSDEHGLNCLLVDGNWYGGTDVDDMNEDINSVYSGDSEKLHYELMEWLIERIEKKEINPVQH